MAREVSYEQSTCLTLPIYALDYQAQASHFHCAYHACSSIRLYNIILIITYYNIIMINDIIFMSHWLPDELRLGISVRLTLPAFQQDVCINKQIVGATCTVTVSNAQ